jgi:hypothetical protein
MANISLTALIGQAQNTKIIIGWLKLRLPHKNITEIKRIKIKAAGKIQTIVNKKITRV